MNFDERMALIQAEKKGYQLGRERERAIWEQKLQAERRMRKVTYGPVYGPVYGPIYGSVISSKLKDVRRELSIRTRINPY